MEKNDAAVSLPHCPILGRPVRRVKRTAGEVAEVSCPEFDVKTGRCRLEHETLRTGRVGLLLEALDAVDGGEGVHCVMQ